RNLFRDCRGLVSGKVGTPLERASEGVPACGSESCFEVIANLAAAHGCAWRHSILAWCENRHVKGIWIDERLVDIETRSALQSSLFHRNARFERQHGIDDSNVVAVQFSGHRSREIVCVEWKSALKDVNARERPTIADPAQ